MFKNTLAVLLIGSSLTFSGSTIAEKSTDKRYSIAFAPFFQDEYDDIGSYAQNEMDDDKYQFQFNIVRDSDFKGFLDEAESSEDYYSLRAVKFTNFQTNPNEAAIQKEGIIAVYGRRYYIFSQNRNGFAYGWYAGAIFADEYIIDLTPDLSGPISGTLANSSVKQNVVIPIATLELLYKWYAYKGLYIEPSIIMGVDTASSGGVEALTQLIIGYEF